MLKELDARWVTDGPQSDRKFFYIVPNCRCSVTLPLIAELERRYEERTHLPGGLAYGPTTNQPHPTDVRNRQPEKEKFLPNHFIIASMSHLLVTTKNINK